MTVEGGAIMHIYEVTEFCYRIAIVEQGVPISKTIIVTIIVFGIVSVEQSMTIIVFDQTRLYIHRGLGRATPEKMLTFF